MKNKLIKLSVTSIILIIIGFFIYLNLPFEIARSYDIKFGNKLIKNIESYKKEYNKLPDNYDWEIFKSLGFKMELLGTQPSYTKIDNDNFEIVFFEGFDGPYLLWNSEEKLWKIDFPSYFK